MAVTEITISWPETEDAEEVRTKVNQLVEQSGDVVRIKQSQFAITVTLDYAGHENDAILAKFERALGSKITVTA